ncbi:uncharacterized protein LOC62_02G001837 [Vanrija pseudolonga]|uniref:ARID domain-containing protein n=1 Tax=Vanrija pseudolonga TaxID=143232 RepID=A0AAF0Y2N4_9TREE|nr:hypothetical protein LOC62_02G001837 [Vanrija pseudolonga]
MGPGPKHKGSRPKPKVPTGSVRTPPLSRTASYASVHAASSAPDSPASSVFSLRSAPPTPNAITGKVHWGRSLHFDVGVVCWYNGLAWRCTTEHASTKNSQPPVRPDLWEKVGFRAPPPTSSAASVASSRPSSPLSSSGNVTPTPGSPTTSIHRSALFADTPPATPASAGFPKKISTHGPKDNHKDKHKSAPKKHAGNAHGHHGHAHHKTSTGSLKSILQPAQATPAAAVVDTVAVAASTNAVAATKAEEKLNAVVAKDDVVAADKEVKVEAKPVETETKVEVKVAETKPESKVEVKVTEKPAVVEAKVKPVAEVKKEAAPAPTPASTPAVTPVATPAPVTKPAPITFFPKKAYTDAVTKLVYRPVTPAPKAEVPAPAPKVVAAPKVEAAAPKTAPAAAAAPAPEVDVPAHPYGYLPTLSEVEAAKAKAPAAPAATSAPKSESVAEVPGATPAKTACSCPHPHVAAPKATPAPAAVKPVVKEEAKPVAAKPVAKKEEAKVAITKAAGPVLANLVSQEQFLRELRTIHGQAFQYPVVANKTVNLYELLAAVVSYGGYRVLDAEPISATWTTVTNFVGYGLGVDPLVPPRIREVYIKYLAGIEVWYLPRPDAPILPWAANTLYEAGTTVLHGKDKFYAKVTHRSTLEESLGFTHLWAALGKPYTLPYVINQVCVPTPKVQAAAPKAAPKVANKFILGYAGPDVTKTKGDSSAPWKAGYRYNVGELAWDGKKVYAAKITHSGTNIESLRYTHLWNPLFTPAYLAIAAAPWAKYSTYYVGDIVSFNGVAYQALLAHTAAHEPTEDLVWTKAPTNRPATIIVIDKPKPTVAKAVSPKLAATPPSPASPKIKKTVSFEDIPSVRQIERNPSPKIDLKRLLPAPAAAAAAAAPALAPSHGSFPAIGELKNIVNEWFEKDKADKAEKDAKLETKVVKVGGVPVEVKVLPDPKPAPTTPVPMHAGRPKRAGHTRTPSAHSFPVAAGLAPVVTAPAAPSSVTSPLASPTDSPLAQLPSEIDFVTELRRLHFNPHLQYPIVNGRQVSMYALFSCVQAIGGSREVSLPCCRQADIQADAQPIDKLWAVAASFVGFTGLIPATLGSHAVYKAIRAVYHEYLGRYEELYVAKARAVKVGEKVKQSAKIKVGPKPVVSEKPVEVKAEPKKVEKVVEKAKEVEKPLEVVKPTEVIEPEVVAVIASEPAPPVDKAIKSEVVAEPRVKFEPEVLAAPAVEKQFAPSFTGRSIDDLKADVKEFWEEKKPEEKAAVPVVKGAPVTASFAPVTAPVLQAPAAAPAPAPTPAPSADDDIKIDISEAEFRVRLEAVHNRAVAYPIVNGRQVNLYSLFTFVLANGGSGALDKDFDKLWPVAAAFVGFRGLTPDHLGALALVNQIRNLYQTYLGRLEEAYWVKKSGKIEQPKVEVTVKPEAAPAPKPVAAAPKPERAPAKKPRTLQPTGQVIRDALAAERKEKKEAEAKAKAEKKVEPKVEAPKAVDPTTVSEQFFLDRLHEAHGTKNLQPAFVVNKKISLYALYSFVIANGGYKLFDAQPIEDLWTRATIAIGFNDLVLGTPSAIVTVSRVKDIYRIFLKRLEDKVSALVEADHQIRATKPANAVQEKVVVEEKKEVKPAAAAPVAAATPAVAPAVSKDKEVSAPAVLPAPPAPVLPIVGDTGVTRWKTDTFYNAGAVVLHGVSAYRAKIGHRSSKVEALTYHNLWEKVKVVPDWVKDKEYKSGDVALSAGEEWEALRDHKSAKPPTEDDLWTSRTNPPRVKKVSPVSVTPIPVVVNTGIRPESVVNWRFNTLFRVGDVVWWAGRAFKCKLEHVSGDRVSPPLRNCHKGADISQLPWDSKIWDKVPDLSPPAPLAASPAAPRTTPDWEKGVPYSTGSVVWFAGKNWRSIKGHISTAVQTPWVKDLWVKVEDHELDGLVIPPAPKVAPAVVASAPATAPVAAAPAPKVEAPKSTPVVSALYTRLNRVPWEYGHLYEEGAVPWIGETPWRCVAAPKEGVSTGLWIKHTDIAKEWKPQSVPEGVPKVAAQAPKAPSAPSKKQVVPTAWTYGVKYTAGQVVSHGSGLWRAEKDHVSGEYVSVPPGTVMDWRSLAKSPAQGVQNGLWSEFKPRADEVLVQATVPAPVLKPAVSAAPAPSVAVSPVPKIKVPEPEITNWNWNGVQYRVGQVVFHADRHWRVAQDHVSTSAVLPHQGAVSGLWELVGEKSPSAHWPPEVAVVDSLSTGEKVVVDKVAIDVAKTDKPKKNPVVKVKDFGVASRPASEVDPTPLPKVRPKSGVSDGNKGDWKPYTKYDVGDIVWYQGVAWKCIRSPTNKTAPSSDQFWETVKAPTPAVPAPSIAQILDEPVSSDIRTWSRNVHFAVGDVVSHSGAAWKCVFAHTSVLEPSQGVLWDKESGQQHLVPAQSAGPSTTTSTPIDTSASVPWARAATYEPGAVVKHVDGVWIALFKHIGVLPPSEGVLWHLVAGTPAPVSVASAPTSAPAPAPTPVPARKTYVGPVHWEPHKTYPKGTLVWTGAWVWESLETHTSRKVPAHSREHWRLVGSRWDRSPSYVAN